MKNAHTFVNGITNYCLRANISEKERCPPLSRLALLHNSAVITLQLARRVFGRDFQSP